MGSNYSGSALELAHEIPLHTADIDSTLIKSYINISILAKLVKKTGQELKISPDWLNPYFGTFFMNLPSDYSYPDADSRRNILKRLFQEKKEVRMKDYLNTLGRKISRQQALKDLSAVAELQGKGRGAVWRVKTNI